MATKSNGEHIVIEEKDLPPEGKVLGYAHPDSVDIRIGLMDLPKFLEITEKDLLAIDSNSLVVTLADLAKIDQRILRITNKDLPEIVRIGMGDLPADLNYMTTECYHGTSRAAAEDIKKQGFRVGPGNALGSGIYFSVGAVTIAQSYLKGSEPCFIRAGVDWGRVAYLDKPEVIAAIGSGSGDARTDVALKKGYHTLLTNSKFSKESPAIGVVLGKQGSHIRPPRIEIIELINPNNSRPY